MKNMQTEVFIWHNLTCYDHVSGHVLTLQYFWNTLECLELLETGWKTKHDFANFVRNL